MHLDWMKPAVGCIVLLGICFMGCDRSTQPESENPAISDEVIAVESTLPGGQEVSQDVFDDTVSHVSTERILDLLDKTKEQIAVKEASLAERENKVQKELAHAARLRLFAWIVLSVGVILCLAAVTMICRKQHLYGSKTKNKGVK
ncbi:MAG TPA: hypothetical protein ENN17_12835 [bacterium]|nr:hypothetical protein [bacterium]